MGLGIFNLVFLSHYLTKCKGFCYHWKGIFLDFPKVTFLLSLVHSWELQRALKWKKAGKKHFWRGTPSSTIIRSPKPWKAYFSKWTPSGEPPVGTRSLSDWNFRSNKLLLSDGYYGRPCIIYNICMKINCDIIFQGKLKAPLSLNISSFLAPTGAQDVKMCVRPSVPFV